MTIANSPNVATEGVSRRRRAGSECVNADLDELALCDVTVEIANEKTEPLATAPVGTPRTAKY